MLHQGDECKVESVLTVLHYKFNINYQLMLLCPYTSSLIVGNAFSCVILKMLLVKQCTFGKSSILILFEV